MATTLLNYGMILSTLTQLSEAAKLKKEAVPLFRDLSETTKADPEGLCDSLHEYGKTCYSLGQHKEAVLAYQESLPLWHAWVARDPSQRVFLAAALHDMANSLHALDKNAAADAAAIEALQMNDGKWLETCDYAPNFGSCFVCQRATTSAIPHKVSQGRKRDKLLQLFRRDRA